MAKTLSEEDLQKLILLEDYFYVFITDSKLKGWTDATIIENWKELSAKLKKKSFEKLTEEFEKYSNHVNLVQRYLHTLDRNRAALGYDVQQRQKVINREKENLF